MDNKLGHFFRLPLDDIKENIYADPQVSYTNEEIMEVLNDLYEAVDNKSYIPQTSTSENPSLSDDYIFDTNDENFILKDLTIDNFVAKVKDLGKGAEKRRKKGFPEEYLYIFKYACRLLRRDAQMSGTIREDILIYIKINDRKIPYEKVFVISFHKNKPKR